MLHSVTECYIVLQSVTDCYRVLHRTSRSLFNRRSGAVTIYASSPRACNNHSPFIKPRSHLSDSSVPLDVRTSPVSNSRRRVMIGECLLSDPSGANLSLVFPSSLPSPSRPESGFYSPTPELISTQPNTLTESLATKRGNFFCNTVQSFQIVLCTIR